MQKWLYVNDDKNSVRYMLGTVGKKTLVCFGINPSTAEPDHLDPTLESVERLASNNGFDSWVMFNVYPKRNTAFDDLHDFRDDEIHQENLRIIKSYFDSKSEVCVWAAWGEHINEKDYLIPCFKEIYRTVKVDKISWVAIGVNKSGSPKHPLYQKATSVLKPFDMEKYVAHL